MAKDTNAIYNNFSNGMVSERMRRRADLGFYMNSARLMRNLLPLQTGGFVLRPGTKTQDQIVLEKYVININGQLQDAYDEKVTPFPADAVRIIPFVKKVTEYYIVVLSPRSLKVYKPYINKDTWEEQAVTLSPYNETTPTMGTMFDYTNNKAIQEIQYTQDSSRLIMCHRGHHPLVMEFSKTAITLGKLKLDSVTSKKSEDGSGYESFDYDNLFAKEDKYPGTCAFCANRLWFGSTNSNPYGLWASRPFKYNNFQDYEWYSYVDDETTVKQYLNAITGNSTEKIYKDDGSFLLVKVEIILDENGKSTGKFKQITEEHRPVSSNEFGSKIISEHIEDTAEDGSYTSEETTPILTSENKPSGKLKVVSKRCALNSNGLYECTVTGEKNIDSEPDYSYNAVETVFVSAGKIKRTTRRYTLGGDNVTIVKEEIIDYSSPVTKWEKTVTADCSMFFETGSDRDERIEWINAYDNIIIGTASSEWIIPWNINALEPSIKKIGAYGSCMDKNCVTGGTGIFYPQSGGKRVRGFISSNEGFSFMDMNYLCPDILSSGIKEMHWQRVPYQRLYVVLNDGSLAVLCYEPDYGINAWVEWTFDTELLSLAIIDDEGGQSIYALFKTSEGTELCRFDDTVYSDHVNRNTEVKPVDFIGELETNGIDDLSTLATAKNAFTIYVDSQGTNFKAGVVGSAIRGHRSSVHHDLELVDTFSPNTYDELKIRIESYPAEPLTVLAIKAEIGLGR